MTKEKNNSLIPGLLIGALIVFMYFTFVVPSTTVHNTAYGKTIYYENQTVSDWQHTGIGVTRVFDTNCNSICGGYDAKLGSIYYNYDNNSFDYKCRCQNLVCR